MQTEVKKQRFERKSEQGPRKKPPDHHYVIELEALSTKGKESDYTDIVYSTGADKENVAKNRDTNYIISTLTNLANQTGTNFKKDKKDKQHRKHKKDKQHKKKKKDKQHKKHKKKKKNKQNKKEKTKDRGKTDKKHKKEKRNKKDKSNKKGHNDTDMEKA